MRATHNIVFFLRISPVHRSVQFCCNPPELPVTGGSDGSDTDHWAMVQSQPVIHNRWETIMEPSRSGYKYNCLEDGTGITYWVSGPKKRGGDRLYGGIVEIDADSRVEYWTKIRRKPESVGLKQTR
jgi:hypothetical protein